MTPKIPHHNPTGRFRRVVSFLFGFCLALTGAWAQTATSSPAEKPSAKATDSKDEDIVVLTTFKVEGQREGQSRALTQQRSSDNLKSVASSDTLGRFPDQNAAETLGRISGVSLARDQGEGRFISIRGVDPDLNNTQLNGVNIPASQEDSRSVNLDVFPSDLLDSIEVVKAITPDMDGDAIGGSVNLKTQTAFSQSDRVMRVSAEGQYNELTGQWGHKTSVVWGDKFKDGKLGLLIALSEAKRSFGSDGRETDDNPWVSDPERHTWCFLSHARWRYPAP